MKKMFPYVALVIAAIIIFDKVNPISDSGPAPTSKPSTPTTADANNVAMVAEPYALRAADYSWPVIQSNDRIAPSLLAKNYYLIIDGSGSMLETECSQGSTKMAVAKSAFQLFMEQLSVDTNIGLYAFDNRGIGQLVALGQNNRQQLLSALSQITPGGGTPLSYSIADGMQALSLQAQAQLGYGEYHLVVITDGNASSGYSPEPAIKDILTHTPINIHTIGFCIDDQHPLNQPGLTFYRSANDPDSLQAGLQAVLAEAPDFTLTAFDQ